MTASSPDHDLKSAGKLVNKPSFLDYGKYRFIIHDAPTDQNLPSYIEVFKKRGVVAVVRACEPTYSTQPLIDAGIRVVELAFADGDPPPDNIVKEWLNVVDTEFSKPGEPVIAVHCVAGLGRAPCLVAIALIESGMPPLDAIEFIRKRRRGAINAKQIKFLESYRPRSKTQSCCTIM